VLVGPKEKAEVGQGCTAFMLQGQRKAGQFIGSRGHRGAFLRLPKAPSPYSICFPKAKAVLAAGASTALCVDIRGGSDGFLPSAPPQGDKPTARHHQARQSRTDDGAGDRDVDRAR